jgi:hypothetical protein
MLLYSSKSASRLMQPNGDPRIATNLVITNLNQGYNIDYV